jgi:hypothetical protein
MLAEKVRLEEFVTALTSDMVDDMKGPDQVTDAAVRATEVQPSGLTASA